MNIASQTQPLLLPLNPVTQDCSKELRKSGPSRANKPTLPVLLEAELAQNPFLRPGSAEIQNRLGMTGHPLAIIFSELRTLKDRF